MPVQGAQVSVTVTSSPRRKRNRNGDDGITVTSSPRRKRNATVTSSMSTSHTAHPAKVQRTNSGQRVTQLDYEEAEEQNDKKQLAMSSSLIKSFLPNKFYYYAYWLGTVKVQGPTCPWKGFGQSELHYCLRKITDTTEVTPYWAHHGNYWSSFYKFRSDEIRRVLEWALKTSNFETTQDDGDYTTIVVRIDDYRKAVPQHDKQTP
jgi:hypothetical protein